MQGRMLKEGIDFVAGNKKLQKMFKELGGMKKQLESVMKNADKVKFK